MLKQSIAIGLVTALFAVGCSKKVEEQTTNSAKPNLKTISAPTFTYYTFGTDITEDDLLSNPDDPAEEAFNHIDFALTLGLLEIYHNHPTIMAELVSDINGTRNKCYNLLTFAQENPTVNTIFNTVFASRFEDFSGYANWQAYVAEKYKYDVSYIPFARFANIGDNLDVNLPAYVAAPFEVNEEKFTTFDNHIPVWINDGSGETKLTTVNEPMAKGIFNPMVLVANNHLGAAEAIFNPIYEPPSTPPSVPMSCGLPPSQHLHEYLTHTKFKINHRYERTGKSDYVFVWVSRLAYLPTINNWNDVTVTESAEKGVHKNDIGNTLFDFEFTVFSPDMYASPRCFEIQLMSLSQQLYKGYAVGAYEKDWYAGWKDVMHASNSVQEETWKGRRKFDSEWYFFDPITNRSYPFNTRNPTQHSTYINYTKGELRLHRWNY